MRNFRLFSLKEIYRQKEEGAETTGIMRPQMFLLKISVKQSVDSQTGRHQFTLTTFQIDERRIPNEGFFSSSHSFSFATYSNH